LETCVILFLETYFPTKSSTGRTEMLTRGDKIEELIKLQRPMPLFNGYHQQFYVSVSTPFVVFHVKNIISNTLSR